jgi:hypothetical protein
MLRLLDASDRSETVLRIEVWRDAGKTDSERKRARIRKTEEITRRETEKHEEKTGVGSQKEAESEGDRKGIKSILVRESSKGGRSKRCD